MASGREDAASTEWLADIPLFEGMPEADLARVARLGKRVEVETGELLVDQGDPGTYCYAIASGTAGVYANAEHLATVGPGSMIGEMALVDHRPRTATVMATEPMVLLRFDTQSFKLLLQDMPKAAERIHAILASRLR